MGSDGRRGAGTCWLTLWEVLNKTSFLRWDTLSCAEKPFSCPRSARQGDAVVVAGGRFVPALLHAAVWLGDGSVVPGEPTAPRVTLLQQQTHHLPTGNGHHSWGGRGVAHRRRLLSPFPGIWMWDEAGATLNLWKNRSASVLLLLGTLAPRPQGITRCPAPSLELLP